MEFSRYIWIKEQRSEIKKLKNDNRELVNKDINRADILSYNIHTKIRWRFVSNIT